MTRNRRMNLTPGNKHVEDKLEKLCMQVAAKQTLIWMPGRGLIIYENLIRLHCYGFLKKLHAFGINLIQLSVVSKKLICLSFLYSSRIKAFVRINSFDNRQDMKKSYHTPSEVNLICHKHWNAKKTWR